MAIGEWVYLWSITKGTQRGNIHSLNLPFPDLKYKVVLFNGHKEVETIEADDLDYCREIAEEFVLNQLRSV